MNLNIQTQICGLIVVAFLLIFYNTQRTLKTFRESLFKVCLWVTFASVCFDILSIFFIHFSENYEGNLSNTLVEFVCKFYLVSLLSVSFTCFFYILTGPIKEKNRRTLLKIGIPVFLAEAATIMIVPINYFEDGRIVYSEGPSAICCYIFSGIYFILTFICGLILFRKRNHRRAFASVFWMLFWLTAAIVQFIWKELLVVGFAGCAGMIILYILLENPDSNLDKQFNCFNRYAFDVYCYDARTYNKPFSVMEISILNENLFSSDDSGRVKLSHIINRISKYKFLKVFRNADFSLRVVCSDKGKLIEFFNEKISKNSEFSDLIKNGGFVLVENNSLFANSEELRNLISYIKPECKDHPGELLVLDDALLKKYRQDKLMEQEIKKALEEDRVIVFYQPIYSVVEKTFKTAEALVRIVDTDRRLIPPGRFIQIAEKSDLISLIGKRVFEKVCGFISNEKFNSLNLNYIEINLSVVQCEKQELAAEFTEIINKFGLDCKKINLEITETSSVKTKGILLKNMNTLLNMGVSFSLDDFGVGESNIDYLIDMPISILKFDSSMTKIFLTNEKAKYTLTSVIQLAHSLNIKVVAEGVETKEQFEVFKSVGVDFIQGFYFAKPMPMNEFIEFIKGTLN